MPLILLATLFGADPITTPAPVLMPAPVTMTVPVTVCPDPACPVPTAARPPAAPPAPRLVPVTHLECRHGRCVRVVRWEWR
jgi:hypothetical protein